MTDAESKWRTKVTYREPPWSRTTRLVHMIVICLVLEAIVIGYIWPPGASPSPIWLQVIGVTLLLSLPFTVIMLCDARKSSQLTLHPDAMRTSGLIFRRRILYEDIRLIRLDHIEVDVVYGILSVSAVKLKLRRVDGGASNIILNKSDGEQCVHELRRLSPQAAAFAFDDEVYFPVSDECDREAVLALATALLQRARWNLVIAILLAASVAALPLVAMQPVVRSIGPHPALLLLGGVVCVFAVASFASTSFEQRRVRRNILGRLTRAQTDGLIESETWAED